jgi:uncharacterized protein (TIGR03435 family)
MHKLIILAATLFTLSNPLLPAQTTPASAAAAIPPSTATPAQASSFDVATIKPFHPGSQAFTGIVNTPEGVHASDANLAMLVVYAYGLRTADQVTGPDWLRTEWFDVVAKMSAADIAEMQKLSSAESNARRALMMQALLADRFQLKAHPTTKQVPVYDLVVAKGSSKLIDAALTQTRPGERGRTASPQPAYIF